MNITKLFLLCLFWAAMLLVGIIVPMACTNTSAYFVPTSPTTPVVPSATATNAFGFTSTPTFTLQPTNTATNTPTQATGMTGGSTLYTPNLPSGLAVAGSPISIYVAGGDGYLSVYSGGGQVTHFDQYNSISMSNLAAVVVDPTNTNYYVLDEGNGAVYEFKISDNSAVNTWNSYNGVTAFNHPQGIAVDSYGLVYVADTGNNLIDIFSAGGTSSLSQFGGPGPGSGTFSSPSAVAVSITAAPATIIYVADAGNGFIQKLDFLGDSNGQFSTVANSDIFGISIDGSGNVYAADYSTTNPMVEEYNSTGTLTAQWNGPGGPTFGPDGVVFNGSTLYVADYDNSKIYSVTP